MSLIGIGGNKYGPNLNSIDTTRQVLDEAGEFGINFIDTAAAYGGGESESYFGQALRGRRDRFIIATKTYLDNREDGVAKYLRECVELSLRKLETDHVDLYQVHRADPSVPADELMAALEDLIHEGKVREIGCSNYASWRMVESNLRAAMSGSHQFVSIQREYNLLKRAAESELFSACVEHNVALIPYFPLASGLLWRGRLQGHERWILGPVGKPAHLERTVAILSALEEFAVDSGHRLGELAIAWLAAHVIVGSVIVGVRSREQLRNAADSTSWNLSPSELQAVNEITSTGEEVAADDPFARRSSSPLH